MNLLVTNAQAPQAYAVIRALRPYAGRVVATVEGDGRWARWAHAAHSRLVDRVCRVPSPIDDWWSGRVTSEGNSAAEQAFVDAVAGICERERIDVIFPSWDPLVYVLAKNKALFAARGVTVPVPDLDTALTALDKHRTIAIAQSVGFPCPVTHLYESEDQALSLAASLGFPLVLKPRFTSGGRGMAVVQDRAELERRLPAVVAAHGAPLIQEYIPGGRRDSVQFVVGRDGEIRFAFHKHRQRTFRRTARFGTVSESASPAGRAAAAAPLVRALGWWGAMGIETIHDPRDGVHKLMEVNPRFPRQLWNRTELGVNEPWMCVRLARGEEVAPEAACPEGVLFVSPIEDLELFVLQLLDRLSFVARTAIGRRPALDPLSPPPSLFAQARSFGGTYFSRQRKVWDPYSRYFLQDPIASLLWWLQFSSWLVGSRHEVGR